MAWVDVLVWAVTTIVYVAGGVPWFALPPLLPPQLPNKSRQGVASRSKARRRRDRPPVTKTIPNMRSDPTHIDAIRSNPAGGDDIADEVAETFVWIVTVADHAVVPLNGTEFGEMLQVASGGGVPQVKVTV